MNGYKDEWIDEMLLNSIVLRSIERTIHKYPIIIIIIIIIKIVHKVQN